METAKKDIGIIGERFRESAEKKETLAKDLCRSVFQVAQGNGDWFAMEPQYVAGIMEGAGRCRRSIQVDSGGSQIPLVIDGSSKENSGPGSP